MTDVDLRALERLALTGDRQAMAKLLVAETRAGMPAPLGHQLVVLSYRREYRIVHHGDTEASASNDSELTSTVVESVDAAVNFIVACVREDPRASFCHVVFVSWEGLADFMGRQRFETTRATEEWSWDWNRRGQSVRVAHPDVDYETEGWERREEQEREAGRLSLAINALVMEKLAAGGKAKRG